MPNANLLKPSTYSTQGFTFIRERNLLVTEASSLPGGLRFGRVYADACDEGLTLVSHRTGRQVVYALVDVLTDADGDLTGWDLEPAERGTGLPTLRIFND